MGGLALAAEPVRSKAWALSHAFERVGGLLTGDDLALLLRPSIDQPISRVAQWIARRQVVNFAWHTQFLLPVFQFEAVSLQPRPRVAEVIGELKNVYDDWELAAWFAAPNAWLDDDAPAKVITTNPVAVLRAARADRFVARG